MTTTNKRFVAKNGLDNNANSLLNVGVAGSSLTLAAANNVTITTSGDSNITLPTSGTLATTTGAISGNAGTASALQTARTIATSGEAAGTATAFDGSANISIPVTLSNAAVIGKVLTAYAPGAGVVAATDSILGAIQKVDGNVIALTASVSGALVYQGVWNASTNTPTLVSSTGSKGKYYKVSVAGTTAIDGISQWNVGDMIVFNGTTWDKIDGIATEVTSVAGRVGAVTLTSTDVGLGNVTNVAQLPNTQTLAATGDVTAVATALNTGTIATTLAASGVTAGTYTKITVDAKGRATVGASLASTDVTTALGFTPYNATNPSGYITSSGSAATAGTVTTAAQPTITSLGTLTSLSVSGLTTLGSGATGLSMQGNASPIGLGTLYNSSLTLSASNYGMAFGTAITYLNGSTGVNMLANGSVVASITSAGMAITGSLNLNNAQYLYGKDSVGTNTRIAGINASNVCYLGPIDLATVASTFIMAGGQQAAAFTSTGLSVVGAVSSTGLTVTSNSGGTTARFTNASTASGNFIDFYETATSTRLGYIGTPDGVNWKIHNDKSGYLTLDTANTERMRLDASGNVMIGRAAIVGTEKFSLNGTARIETSVDLIGGSGTPEYRLYQASNNWSIRNNAGKLSFYNMTASSDAVVVDATGLAVTGAISATSTVTSSVNGYGFKISNATGNNGWFQSYNGTQNIIFGISSGNLPTLGTVSADPLIFLTGNSERMRLDAAGSVGIGVTPATWASGGFKPLQIMSSTLAAYDPGTSNLQTELMTNSYQSSLGVYNYIKSFGALQYRQINTVGHVWNYAAAGTAGASFTWTTGMTLDTSGVFGLTNGMMKLGSSQTSYIAGDNATLYFGISSAEKARIDTNGNLGIGVTPSAWSGMKAVEMSTLAGGLSASAGATYMNTNVYWDGTSWKYKTTSSASQYIQTVATSAHQWLVAPSGTAGTAATLTMAMVLDLNGNLNVNNAAFPSAGLGSNYLGIGLNGATWIANGTNNSQWRTNISGTSAAPTYASTNPAASYNQILGNHVWYTAPSGTAGAAITGSTQVMSLDTSGNLNVGVASYSAAVVANGANSGTGGGTAFIAQNSGSSIVAIGNYSKLIGGAYDASATVWRSGVLKFYNSSLASVDMVLDAAGNLGIGTSAPTATSKLDVRFAANPAVNNGSVSNAMIVSTTIAQAAGVGGAISLGGTAAAAGSGNVGFAQLAGRKENGTAANYAGYLQIAVNNAGGTMFEAARIDSLGNLGIGVAPSAWGSNFRGVELPSGVGFFTNSGGIAFTFNNAYYDGTNYIYKGTGFATVDYTQNGVHYWNYAASGTAGGTITWMPGMNLNASGALSVTSSVTASSFSGAGTGLTGTAAGLNIGGAAANAPAGTLTGTTINATVTASSLTSVGTLTSLTSSGTITGASFVTSASASVAAAGTTQATATALSSDFNVVASGTGGVILAGATAGRAMTVINKSGSTINIYPATGHQIDAGGANVAVALVNNGMLEVFCTASTQWYSTQNAIINGAYVSGTVASATTAANAPAGTLTGTVLAAGVTDSSLTSVGTLVSLGVGTANAVSGTIVASGNITAFSDERLKTNWHDLSVDLVSQLAGVKVGVYDRTDVHATQVGVSAQSLQAIMPEAVITGEDGTLSVAYGNAALAACVMLAKEVEALKAEIAALKG